MTFRGHIQNGKVVFDTPVTLPEGTEVEVLRRTRTKRKPRAKAKKKSSPKRVRKKRKTFAEVMRPLLGIAKGLPSDASVNVDHCLYGAPKR